MTTTTHRLTAPQAWALHRVLEDVMADDLTEGEHAIWNLAYEAGRDGRSLTLQPGTAAVLQGMVLAYDEPEDWPAQGLATLRRALGALER